MPRAVAAPTSARDVLEIVRWANRTGVRVALRGKGHTQAGQSLTAGGVQIERHGTRDRPHGRHPMEHQVMNHALVAVDAGGDAVEQTGGGGCPPPRLRSRPGRRFADEGHRPAASPDMPAAMPARGHVDESPRVARPLRHAFLWRRVVGEVLDQIACVASCGVPRAGPRSAPARHRPACRRRQASRWREAHRRDGLSCRRRPPAATTHGLAGARPPGTAPTTTAVSSSVAGSAAPAGRPGLACSELAGEEKRTTGPCPRDGRAPARPAKKLALAARLQSGPHRHEDVRPPESVVRRGAERSAAIYRVLDRSQQPARQGPSAPSAPSASHHRERRPARRTADSPDDRDRIVLTRKSPPRD